MYNVTVAERKSQWDKKQTNWRTEKKSEHGPTFQKAGSQRLTITTYVLNALGSIEKCRKASLTNSHARKRHRDLPCKKDHTATR